jgi:predicted ribosomally synthesized peptide with SipW-like signal peptide
MKKKILVAALAVALIAIMVGGSLAYFTDSDEVTNTFTIGSVRIEIYENDEATEEDTISFGSLMPIVNTQDPSADISYIEKVVDVKNTGNNDAYIRAHIALPTALIDFLQLDVTADGWAYIGATTATVDGVEYTVFTYDHLAAVAPDAFTNELLQGVYLKSNVDLVEDANGNLVFVLRDADGKITKTSDFIAHTKNANGTYTSNSINILIASQAIQTQGFNNGATDALNAGFGANTNPWQ